MKYVCLPAEWMNYIYHPIEIPKLQPELYRMTVVDTSPTDHGLAIRIKYIPTPDRPADPDFPSHEKIVIISGVGDNISAEYADMEKDRLPGHPINNTDLQG